MKKLIKAVLAVALVAFFSSVALAVWDSTTGNMPNFYNLCFGSGSSDGMTGSSITHYVELFTNSAVGIYINSSGQVGIGTAAPTNTLSVSGNANVTGNMTVSGNTTVTGTLQGPLPIASTTTLETTAYPVGQPILVAEDSLTTGVPYTTGQLYNLGVSTANNQASCVYIAVSTNLAKAVTATACAN